MSETREKIPPSTPDNYSLFYERCWDQERDEIIRILKREEIDIKLTGLINEIHNINKLTTVFKS